ncbi:MAG TPA: hypothetical protein VIY48_03100, partial [Candidatus Paceibacterota bacterium]
MYYDMTQNGQGQQRNIYNTMETGANPGELNWSDIVGGSESSGSGSSNQWSGLPQWFQGGATGNNSINNLWNAALQYGGQAWGNAINGGQVNPNTAALIERQRQLMPQQYANEMSDYYNRQINPLMNSLSSRGVLNSSVTGDALAKALRTQAAKQSDQVTQANTWAGNELLKNMATQQGMNMDTWK